MSETKPEGSTEPKKEPAKPVEPVKLLATISPHVHAPEDVARIMWMVVVALMPAMIAAIYYFGFKALQITLISVISAVAVEAALQKFRGKKNTISDGSAVVTGILVAFVLPTNSPWFVPLIGSAFAIGVAKMAFGGLGLNIWNPALAGRAFVVACFAGLAIGGWVDIPATQDTPATKANWIQVDKEKQSAADEYTRVDAMTGASPLTAQKDYLLALRKLALAEAANKEPGATAQALAAKIEKTPAETVKRVQQENNTPIIDLFLGARVGCVGETSALALLIGGMFLLVMGIISWHTPVAFIATVAVLGWLLPVQAPAFADGKFFVDWVWGAGDPAFQVLSGGVMIGALFMATDMVTSPITRTGQLIFGIGCGAITILIRKYGGYPEGVCYSILLMNTTVPLIDTFTKPRVYGKKK